MKNHMKRHALSFAAVMALVLGGGMQLCAADKKADTVYHNGTIYTMTETMEEAQSPSNAKKAEVVATLNGKIVFVGSESEAKANVRSQPEQLSARHHDLHRRLHRRPEGQVRRNQRSQPVGCGLGL